MTHNKPLVSIIIPSYNRAWILEETLKSIYKDNYRPIECLVVDDGSTDETREVIQKYIEEAPLGIEVKYIYKSNGGVSSARNLGIQAATGAYIGFLDSDDTFINNSIEKRVSALIENKTDIAYGLSRIVNQQNELIRLVGKKISSQSSWLISEYTFHTSAPIITREVVEKAGFWRVDDPNGQEHEYFARLKYFANSISFIDDPVSNYVKHEQGNLYDGRKEYQLEAIRILISIKSMITLSKFDTLEERELLASHFVTNARKLYRFKDYKNSLVALNEALSTSFSFKVLLYWIYIKMKSKFSS